MNRIICSLVCVLALGMTARAEQVKFTITPNFFESNPGQSQLGPCHGGVVIDHAGNIYVSTDTPRGIVVFSPNGKYLRSFGPDVIHGMELRKEKGVEYIYGARHSAHKVVKLKLDGTVVWTIEYPKEAGTMKDAGGFNPCAVTVGPDGEIFIADGYGSNFIYKYDKNLKFIKAFGGPAKGAEEGKFNTCHGIALDTRGKKPLLLVCNRGLDRVEHWDLDGNFVEIIQKGLRMPAAVNIRGKYAVIAELKGRTTVLNKKGEIVAQLGDNPDNTQWANFGLPADKWKDGICNSPHGAALDKDGNVIVAEWSQFGHLHKFVRTK